MSKFVEEKMLSACAEATGPEQGADTNADKVAEK